MTTTLRVDHPWIDPEQAPLTPEWYERQALKDQQCLRADQLMDLEQEQLDHDEQPYPYRFGS